MTLNRYQKLQSDIHLDEKQKEAMVRALLKADIRPVRKRFPVRAVLSLAAVVLAVFFLYPGRYFGAKGGASSGAYSPETAAGGAVNGAAPAEVPESTAVNAPTAADNSGFSYETLQEEGSKEDYITLIIEDTEVFCNSDYTYAYFIHNGEKYEIFREEAEAETEDETEWIREYLEELKGKEHE